MSDACRLNGSMKNGKVLSKFNMFAIPLKVRNDIIKRHLPVLHFGPDNVYNTAFSLAYASKSSCHRAPMLLN